MMDLATFTLILSGLGAVLTGFFGFAFLLNPEKGMAIVTHRAEQLPNVMTDRYFALSALAVGATLYGDLTVISFLFAVFAFLGFADAFIYLKRGFPYVTHLAAGIAATLVALIACYAHSTTGVSV